MIEIRFFDVDPDTGYITQDKLIAITETESMTNWVKAALYEYGADDNPNRTIYLSTEVTSQGSFHERIGWLISKYYEEGLEFESLCRNMKDVDLDQFVLRDGKIGIPKLRKDLVALQNR
jgi:hypothetical protein